MSVEKQRHDDHARETRHHRADKPGQESAAVLSSSNAWHEGAHNPQLRQAANEALKNQGIVPDLKIGGQEAASVEQLRNGQRVADNHATQAGKDMRRSGEDIEARDIARTQSRQNSEDIARGYNTASSLMGKGADGNPLTKGDAADLLAGKVKDQSHNPIELNSEQQAAVQALVKNWDTPEAKAMQTEKDGKPAGFTDKSTEAGKKGLDQKNDLEEKADAKSQKHDLDAQKQAEKDAKTLKAASELTHEAQNALKVRKGEGPYQVAQRMLGLDGKHHSAAEVMRLTRLIQHEAQDENGGKRVGTFKAGSVIHDTGALMHKISLDAAAAKGESAE